MNAFDVNIISELNHLFPMDLLYFRMRSGQFYFYGFPPFLINDICQMNMHFYFCVRKNYYKCRLIEIGVICMR